MEEGRKEERKGENGSKSVLSIDIINILVVLQGINKITSPSANRKAINY